MIDLLEKLIEGPVAKIFKERGWKYRKQAGHGDRGKADKFFLGPNGKIIFVEFKRSGKPLTELQAKELGDLVELGFLAVKIDNIEDGELLCQYLNEEYDWGRYHRNPVTHAYLFPGQFKTYCEQCYNCLLYTSPSPRDS